MTAYILPSCSTCQRILKEIDWSGDIYDIKANGVPAKILDILEEEHGSYESLFSKRAMKYRAQGLHEKELSEKDFRKLILGEYTFLKRPAFVIGDKTFVGNSKKVVTAIKEHLQSLS